MASPPNGTGLLSKPQSIPIPAPVSISSEKWKDGKKQYPCSYPILTPAACCFHIIHIKIPLMNTIRFLNTPKCDKPD